MKMKTDSISGSGPSSNSQLRLIVLAILVVQNCSLILLMRYSRLTQSSPGSTNSGNSYIISTAVILSELIKFIISFIVIYFQKAQITSSSTSSSSSLSSLINRHNLVIQRVCYEDFYLNSIELLKLSIPSFLYVIQNNLQYLGVTYLSVSIFQILSQLKIVTTAIFSVVMLRNKKLSPQQWMSIVALTCGVGLVQYTQSQQQQQKVVTAADLGMKNGQDSSSTYLLGVLCVLFSCVTSGFSGVYFERVLKSGGLTLWMRNTHLSFIGLLLSAILCLYNDHKAISANGFFFGYNSIVWIVILLQAGGGLIVASVVMYADNVLKGFATSFSVILSCLISSWLLETSSSASVSGGNVNPLFVLGAAIVVSSAFIYSLYPASSVAPSLPAAIQGMVPRGGGGVGDGSNRSSQEDIENKDSC